MGFFTDMACGLIDIAGGNMDLFVQDMNFAETQDAMRQSAREVAEEIRFQNELIRMQNDNIPVYDNRRY